MTFEKSELQNTIEKAIVEGNVTVFQGNSRDLIKGIINSDKTENKKNNVDIHKNCKKEIQKFIKQNEILQNDLNNYKDQYNILLEKQNKMETILDSLGANDNFEDFINFITFLYENKEDFFNYIKYKNEFLDFLHNKNNNINIDINNNHEYIKLKQDYISLKTINDDNNSRILDLETKLGMLNSNVKDENLFEQLKNKNKTLQDDLERLNQENSELRNKNPEKSNLENNIDKQSIIDEITLNLESKFSLEKSEILKKHEEIIKNIKDEKDKIIEELKLKIDKKSINIKKDKENKFINSIKIYEEINSKTREYISSYTYRQINDFNILRNLIIEEYKKEDYDIIIDYMLKYISNKKSKWYFIRKIKRCLYLYDTYKDKLKIFNFSISFLSNLSDDDWNSWINLLNNIIDEKFNKNNEESIEEDVEEELDYDCKNENCVDYVKIRDTYCNDCINHVRNCIECNDEFSDDSDIKTCFNCRDINED